MTKEEAHRILSNGLVNAPSEHEWCTAFIMAIKALEQTEWIPVTERLPKESDEYLLWGRFNEDEDYFRFIGYYDADSEAFGYPEAQYDPHTLGFLSDVFIEYLEVIAWMPLPQPYKAGEEE